MGNWGCFTLLIGVISPHVYTVVIDGVKTTPFQRWRIDTWELAHLVLPKKTSFSGFTNVFQPTPLQNLIPSGILKKLRPPLPLFPRPPQPTPAWTLTRLQMSVKWKPTPNPGRWIDGSEIRRSPVEMIRNSRYLLAGCYTISKRCSAWPFGSLKHPTVSHLKRFIGKSSTPKV